MSWRQAAREVRSTKFEVRSAARRSMLRTSNFELRTSNLTRFLVFNFHHLFGMKTGQERARRVQLELRIACLDDDEEFVLARHVEARVIEHRVIRLRQAIQREHA